MNRYEYVADLFSEMLGTKYDIKYYDNNEKKWEDILIDDMIHGNMLVTGGETTKAAGATIETQQLSITFALPMELNAFSEAIQTIEDSLKALYGPIGSYSGFVLSYSYAYRSDAVKLSVKGTDYAMVTVYGMLISYDNAVLSTEAKVKLNNEKLEGVIAAIYSNQHATEGQIHGFESLEQRNYMIGISAMLTIDLIFRKDDALHLDIMSNIDTDKKYSVDYYNGLVTRTYDMMIIKYDENVVMGDVLKGQVVFGLKGD